MLQNVPRYRSPQERAASRARMLRFVFGTMAALPLLFAIVLFGYSDQAPRWLQVFAVNLDAFFGQPVLSLIKARMAPG